MPDSTDPKVTDDPTICPHCDTKMSKWQASDLNAWGDTVHYVCFNDECPYYKRGWKWMNEKYSVSGSYRHRYNPETGEKGPLPVWSDTSLKSGIIDNDDPEDSDKQEENS